MSELVIILTDLISRVGSELPSVADPLDVVSLALPRLPALETLLARGTRSSLHEDWRAWLAAQVGIDGKASLAATVAAAWPPQEPAAAGHLWLATPVHLFASLDSVHVHPLGLLQLPAHEQQQLVEQFNQAFADSAWRLRSIGQRELLMSGPALYASGADPAGFVGADPTAGLARGPDAASLKRLGAELELWLFEHALNRAREARAELPITTLWLWGGALSGESPAASQQVVRRQAAPRLPRLYGRDSYAEALWRLAGAAAEALPARLDVTARHAAEPVDQVMLYSLRDWQQLEQCWLIPALRALRARRVRALRLLAGRRIYRLSWPHLGRIWRGRAPWWEELLA